MPELKRVSLVKPSNDTRFHIDFDWWAANDRDWHVYLISYLCMDHQKIFADTSTSDLVDWVDPVTAEVQRVDGIQHILISHCAKQSGFISDGVPLVDGIFRIFLANGNIPLTLSELSDRLRRPADTILKVMIGSRVYKGLRPILEKNLPQ